AWKKRWFVLRSGRLTGDPDVLEYYKNDHTKKPIRVIDLNLCEQVDAGLTFNKKDLEHSFIFDIKTIDRVFYLVADTEEEMNKWVRCICDICGFNPTDEESGKHPNQSGNTVVEVPLFSSPPMMGASSVGSLPPPYQPVSIRHLESSSSQEEPQDYLWLSNCESKKLEPASQASSFATEEGEEEYLLLEDFESKKAPLPSPEESFYCTVPITPIKREVSGWERTEENIKLGAQLSADGGSSPMVKPKGDKQVEYLDLDLDSGKSTPPRKKKSNGTSNTSSDERVDYVVVDQQRTQALKNTREAWNDGRQSTESDTPSKGTK
ncbi:UNVERIFIED_CONTAM: hypothetical protein FKN15_049183, partial [Acipenser sinensis]